MKRRKFIKIHLSDKEQEAFDSVASEFGYESTEAYIKEALREHIKDLMDDFRAADALDREIEEAN